jgi:hypothetical protein
MPLFYNKLKITFLFHVFIKICKEWPWWTKDSTTLLNVFPQLTKIDQEYIWGETHEQAFEELKVRFISIPILSNTYQPKYKIQWEVPKVMWKNVDQSSYNFTRPS